MNNTLENGFRILEYLAEEAAECSVKEVAERFGLPNSHACRLLKSLVQTGYVVQTPGSRKYRIGLRILELSNARLRRISLRNAARPHLRQLSDALRCPVYLSLSNGGFSLIVATEYPPETADDAGIAIGQVHPVNRSACGKVCAAFASREELAGLLPRCDYTASTERSITDEAGFLAELAEIRSRGYSTLYGDSAPGVGGIGAPVVDGAPPGVFIGAVGALMPPGEQAWTDELRHDFITRTVACAAAISAATAALPNQGRL